MFADPVPRGADVLLVSNILHDWDVPANREIVGRLRRRSQRRAATDSRRLSERRLDGPLPIALYSAALFSFTEGRAYSAAGIPRVARSGRPGSGTVSRRSSTAVFCRRCGDDRRRLLTAQRSPPTVNVARRLSAMAAPQPDVVAVAAQRGKYPAAGKITISYVSPIGRGQQSDCQRIGAVGYAPGMRLAVSWPGFDFISLVFALLKAGAVAILIDPGMGRRNLVAASKRPSPRVLWPFRWPSGPPAVCRPVSEGAIQCDGRPKTALGRHDRAALRASGAPTSSRWQRGPTIRRQSSSRPAAPALPKACFISMAISTQVEQLGEAFQIARRIDLAGFPLFGFSTVLWGSRPSSR